RAARRHRPARAAGGRQAEFSAVAAGRDGPAARRRPCALTRRSGAASTTGTAGRWTGGDAVATALYPAHNRATRRGRYMMAPNRVKYFFAFGSPFAALADARIDDLVTGAGAELVPIPIVPPQIGSPASGVAAQLQEFKLSYGREDAARWARKLRIPWNPHAAAVDTTDAAAGCYFAAAAGNVRAYRYAVCRAGLSEGRG